VVDFLLSQPNSSRPKRLEKSDRAEKKLIYPKKLFGPKLMGRKNPKNHGLVRKN
jgi:hypothetical protein